MADIKIACPKCKQNLQCDELWCGHQIQCPTCQTTIEVPTKQPAAAQPAPAHHVGNTLVPRVPTAAAPKLSAGSTQVARSSTGVGAPQRSFTQQPKKKSSPAIKYIIIAAAVVIVLGAGGYFGFQQYNDYQEKVKAKQLEEKKQQEQAAAKAARAANPPPEPDKSMTIIPPEWTLDASAAKIPEGRVNGTIAKVDFVADTVRLDRTATGYLLDFRQGAGLSPDEAIFIYLHTPPGQLPTNQTWTISKDTTNPRSAGVGQVERIWKKDPKFAPQRKPFYKGFVLQLELGRLTNNLVLGKVFVALPDPEQTVIGGTFKASLGPVNQQGVTAAPRHGYVPRSKAPPSPSARTARRP